VSTEVSVCGFADDFGVDWRFVRMSSNGDRRDVMEVRATIPAVNGIMDSYGIRGGRTTLRRWSYVNI
jgi:hypothetical protein